MEVSSVVSFLLCFVLLAICNAGNDPRPNPSAVVTVGKARFTVLTDRLVRMEWGQTVDAATFTFINRNLPAPKYQHTTETDPKGETLTVITTESLKVEYLPSDETFSADNLRVTVTLSDGSTKKWSPQPANSTTEYDGNLLGTVRTLDGELGPLDLNCLTQKRSDLHCTFGLVSSSGYVVVDDTGHPQFDTSTDWPWVVNQSLPAASSASCSAVDVSKRRYCGLPSITQFDCIGKGCCYSNSGSPSCYYPMQARQDLYFFGHGDNYKQALSDFILVSGPIPIPPRFAFGIFYSRYWAYDDTGEMDIVRGYEDRSIPLDVLVTDMDWHITFYKESSEGKRDQAGQRIGWTGFTWDEHLFPNPEGFLDWCKNKRLKNTLNLHPASGIQPWEESYSDMAKAMGIDPSTNTYVPFRPTDKEFADNFFNLVIHPLEKQGIDFWWLDWQQGEDWIKIPLVNPTFWLNYLFFTNSYSWKESDPHRRAFLLHRWGGLGNHRYQVGFSGDVFPAWSSLEFQVKFTLRATNVLFGYWSHDIGGHLTLPPPELYTRWVQWGAFSPMFRTHCTKNALNDRRIWVFPLENYQIMRRAMIQRAALVPYIYTQAYTAHKTGLSILRPMYYEHPTVPEAMTYGDTQYFFGEDILVAPITAPVDNITLLAEKEIWIPEGVFISWDSGDMIKGPVVVNRSYLLSEMPVFSKAGSIIPMRTDGFSLMGSAQDIPVSIKFMIFVGTANQGRGLMYEDDGFSDDYLNNPKNSAITNISFIIDEKSPSLLNIAMEPVASAADQFIGMPSSRMYQLALPYFWPADQVVVNDNNIPYCALRDSLSDYHRDCWTYSGPKVTLIINIVSPILINEPLRVMIDFESHVSDDMTVLQNFVKSSRRLQAIKVLLDDQWITHPIYQENYYNLLSANEISNLITYTPSRISSYLDSFDGYYKAALNEMGQIQLNNTLKMRVNSWLNTQ